MGKIMRGYVRLTHFGEEGGGRAEGYFVFKIESGGRGR